MKVLWFDVETTGLNPYKHDIIQLAGFVEIDNEIKEEFNFQIKPHDFDSIEDSALEVNHITRETLESYPDPHEVYTSLMQILDKYVDRFDKTDKFYAAGYNVRFDMDFLKSFFTKNNNKYFGSYFERHPIDPMYLATALSFFGKITVPNHRLVSIAEFFAIEFDAHDALNDIRTTREVMHRLIPLFGEKDAVS